MKPIIITVDKDNNVIMTADEIKTLLEDAYNQGKQSKVEFVTGLCTENDLNQNYQTITTVAMEQEG